MIPTHIRIDHYRALRGLDVPLGDYTPWSPPFGVGNFTVLDALDFFLGLAARSRRMTSGISAQNRDVGRRDARCSHAKKRNGIRRTCLDGAGNLVMAGSSGGEGAPYEVLGRVTPGATGFVPWRVPEKRSDFTESFEAFAGPPRGYRLKVFDPRIDDLQNSASGNPSIPSACDKARSRSRFSGTTKDPVDTESRLVYVPVGARSVHHC